MKKCPGKCQTLHMKEKGICAVINCAKCGTCPLVPCLSLYRTNFVCNFT